MAKREKFEIVLGGSDGGEKRVEVEGRPTAVPELWIHETPDPSALRPHVKGRRWTITHRPTGKATYYARDLAEANLYAKVAGESVSWAFSTVEGAFKVRKAHEAAVDASDRDWLDRH